MIQIRTVNLYINTLNPKLREKINETETFTIQYYIYYFENLSPATPYVRKATSLKFFNESNVRDGRRQVW